MPAKSNQDEPKNVSTIETIQSAAQEQNSDDQPKVLSCTTLNGDITAPGPGVMNDPNSVYVIDPTFARSSSPTKSKSPVKQSKGRTDRPPTNARQSSPRKSRNYLDFDGDDSEDESDGALSQVYTKLDIKKCELKFFYFDKSHTGIFWLIQKSLRLKVT